MSESENEISSLESSSHHSSSSSEEEVTFQEDTHIRDNINYTFLLTHTRHDLKHLGGFLCLVLVWVLVASLISNSPSPVDHTQAYTFLLLLVGVSGALSVMVHLKVVAILTRAMMERTGFVSALCKVLLGVYVLWEGASSTLVVLSGVFLFLTALMDVRWSLFNMQRQLQSGEDLLQTVSQALAREQYVSNAIMVLNVAHTLFLLAWMQVNCIIGRIRFSLHT